MYQHNILHRATSSEIDVRKELLSTLEMLNEVFTIVCIRLLWMSFWNVVHRTRQNTSENLINNFPFLNKIWFLIIFYGYIYTCLILYYHTEQTYIFLIIFIAFFIVCIWDRKNIIISYMPQEENVVCAPQRHTAVRFIRV